MDDSGDALLMALSKDFTKAEIMTIAKELDVAAVGAKKTMIGALLAAVDELSEPEEDDGDLGWDVSEDSDLLYDFLVAAEYVNADGEWLEFDEVEEPATTAQPKVADDGLDDVEKPHCYANADERDPSCRKCKLLEMCKVARVEGRPECFGIAFLASDEQCGACLEIELCKLAMKK